MGLFGLGKKKQKSQEDFGHTAMLPWEIPGGQNYLDTIQSRMKGEGVGYRPEILSGVTSQWGKTRRGQLLNNEIPAINTAASARGLGRSSVVTSQIGRAEQESAQDIANKAAEMELMNEQQRRQEINDAVTKLGGWVNTGVGASATRASQAMQGSDLLHARSMARKKEDNDFRNSLISAGTTGIGGLLGLGGFQGLGNIVSRTGGGAGDPMSQLSMLNELDGMMPSSMVKMAGSNAPQTGWFGGQYNRATPRQLARPGATTRIRPGNAMKGRG
jgi:hypothetical protein